MSDLNQLQAVLSSGLGNVVKGFDSWSGKDDKKGSEPVPMDAIADLNKAMIHGGYWAVANQILQRQRETSFRKAMATGSGLGYSGDASALRLEDLSNVMTRQVFGRNTVPLFQRLTKTPVYNIYAEYNRQTALGTYKRGFPFVSEGKLPRGDDSAYTRMYDLVKYTGTLRAVTDQATRVKTGGGVANLRAAENRAGMDFLLQEIETALYYAKGSCSVVGGQQIAFDGLETLAVNNAPSTNIIDKHGDGLTEEDIQTGAYYQIEVGKHAPAKDQFGRITDVGLFCAPIQSKMINDSLKPMARWNLGNSAGNTKVPGLHVPSVYTQWGNWPIDDDVWISWGRRINETVPSASEGPKPPDAPTAFTVAIVAPGALLATETSHWRASDVANPSYYAVTAKGPNGETAQVVSAPTNVTPAEGGAVDLTITNPLANQPMSFNIWRGTTANNMKLVTEIPLAAGASTTYRDLNYWMPGTTPAFQLVLEEDTLDIAELTPFFSLNLGVIDLTYRWVIMYYLVPRLKNNLKIVMFRNCGENFAG